MDVSDEILYFDTILMDLLARKQTLPSTPVENLKISSSTCRNIGLKKQQQQQQQQQNTAYLHFRCASLAFELLLFCYHLDGCAFY